MVEVRAVQKRVQDQLWWLVNKVDRVKSLQNDDWPTKLRQWNWRNLIRAKLIRWILFSFRPWCQSTTLPHLGFQLKIFQGAKRKNKINYVDVGQFHWSAPMKLVELMLVRSSSAGCLTCAHKVGLLSMQSVSVPALICHSEIQKHREYLKKQKSFCKSEWIN